MAMLQRIWRSVYRSGWFQPPTIGRLLPFPFLWQGWLIFGMLIVSLAGTVFLHGDAARVIRIALVVAYFAIGNLTYA